TSAAGGGSVNRLTPTPRPNEAINPQIRGSTPNRYTGANGSAARPTAPALPTPAQPSTYRINTLAKPPSCAASAPGRVARRQYRAMTIGARNVQPIPAPVKTMMYCKKCGGRSAPAVTTTPTTAVVP